MLNNILRLLKCVYDSKMTTIVLVVILLYVLSFPLAFERASPFIGFDVPSQPNSLGEPGISVLYPKGQGVFRSVLYWGYSPIWKILSYKKWCWVVENEDLLRE